MREGLCPCLARVMYSCMVCALCSDPAKEAIRGSSASCCLLTKLRALVRWQLSRGVSVYG